jgi:hypothetical protein
LPLLMAMIVISIATVGISVLARFHSRPFRDRGEVIVPMFVSDLASTAQPVGAPPERRAIGFLGQGVV